MRDHRQNNKYRLYYATDSTNDKLDPLGPFPCFCGQHYIDVIMGKMASQITSLTIVYSTVYLSADLRKHQSSAPRPLCGEFTGDRGIPRTKGQKRGKCFHSMMKSLAHGRRCHICSIIFHWLISSSAIALRNQKVNHSPDAPFNLLLQAAFYINKKYWRQKPWRQLMQLSNNLMRKKYTSLSILSCKNLLVVRLYFLKLWWW